MKLGKGTRIRTTDQVRCDEGFIPPGTSGEALFAIGENGYHCVFTNVEVRTRTGLEMLTVTATVLEGSLSEIPQLAVV